jgi:hypothetical protein
VIDISINTFSSSQIANSAYEKVSSNTTTITGLGDKADYSSQPGAGLNILKGSKVLNISYLDSKGNVNQSIDTQIAKTILNNL